MSSRDEKENGLEEILQKNENLPKVMTPDNINEFNDYDTKDYDNSEDKWKPYLFEGIQGELKKRLNTMIECSEYKDFFEALKYEYGYGVEKNINLALSIYLKSSESNSTNYLSMARLYDIYRNDYKKFNVKKDRNLELIYLFKSLAYCPLLSISFGNNKNKKFPLNLVHSVFKFFIVNFGENIIMRTFSYIGELMKRNKYKATISQKDYNLICGFLEAWLGAYDESDRNSFDALTALSYSGFNEATYKLAIVYLIRLNKLHEKNEKDKKKEEILKTKIFDIFQILEKNKYYKAYSEYGLFLFNEMRIFDKALQIFKEGYENKKYDCAYYYFLSFTKSNNQIIYEKNHFNSKYFIDIFQALIDGFLYGFYEVLDDIFDYLYIIGKKYKLLSQMRNNYINYINDVAELCLSFVDDKKGDINIKKLFPLNNERIQLTCYHALSRIYINGFSTKIKKNLIKAQEIIKKAIKLDKRSEPYYTRYILKINRIFYKCGIFEDENELIYLEKKFLNYIMIIKILNIMEIPIIIYLENCMRKE